MLQYYLDLSSPYIKMSTENALCEDGYLRMSSCPDYTPMTPKSVTPLLMSLKEDEIDTTGRPHYMNQRSFPMEKGSDVEMQPLIGATKSQRRSSVPDELAPGFVKVDSPMQVHTMAEVHQPDDSDSGHSSSYAPGTSPADNGGYLLPKAYEVAGGSIGTKEGATMRDGASKDRELVDSAFIPTSPTDSVFMPDYHLNICPPPDYRLVVEESEQEMSV